MGNKVTRGYAYYDLITFDWEGTNLTGLIIVIDYTRFPSIQLEEPTYDIFANWNNSDTIFKHVTHSEVVKKCSCTNISNLFRNLRKGFTDEQFEEALKFDLNTLTDDNDKALLLSASSAFKGDLIYFK